MIEGSANYVISIHLYKELKSQLADLGVAGIGNKSTIIGTPVYVAPEIVINDGYYDCKVDIWSLGITCIELAETKTPYHDDHPMRVLFKIPKNPPPTFKEPSKFTKEFNEFIKSCLEKKPQNRPFASQLLEHSFLAHANSHDILKDMMNENLRLRQTLPSFNDIKKKEEEELFERKNRVRKKLLEEIANTESDYVRDIQVLINVRNLKLTLSDYIGIF